MISNSEDKKQFVGKAVPPDKKKGRVDEHFALDLAMFWPYKYLIGEPMTIRRSNVWVGSTEAIKAVPMENSVFVGYNITSATTGEQYSHSYKIETETTLCHFGGERHWFICPSCRRRARILYLPNKKLPSACKFSCRKCLNLTYPNQQTGKFMQGTYDWEQTGLPLLKRARKARKPHIEAKLLERALKYWDGLWEIMERADRRYYKTLEEGMEFIRRYESFCPDE